MSAPQFARTFEQPQAQRVADQDQQRPRVVSQLGDGWHVFQRPEEIGVLQHHAGRFVVDFPSPGRQVRRPARRPDRDQGRIEFRKIGVQDLAVLGMHAGSRHDLAAAAGGADRHQRRFGGGGAAVVETGVRHVHPGQFADQRLVFEHRLQVALGDFRLVGSVGR